MPFQSDVIPSDDLRLDPVELAELFQLALVVAVEEQLVKPGKTKHFFDIVEFDHYRDDASPGGRGRRLLDGWMDRCIGG